MFQDVLSPNKADPTLICVAPNRIASSKSALIPIDSDLSPAIDASLFKYAKYGLASSFAGGIHINPIMGSAKSLIHDLAKSTANCGSIPDF